MREVTIIALKGVNLDIAPASFVSIVGPSGYENVEYPLVMVQNVPAAKRRKQVQDLLQAVGMMDQPERAL